MQFCRRQLRYILMLLKKKLLFYTNIYRVVSKVEWLECFDHNGSTRFPLQWALLYGYGTDFNTKIQHN